MPPLTEEQLQELLSSQFGNRGIASLSHCSPLSFQFEDATIPYSQRMMNLDRMRTPGTVYIDFGEDPAFLVMLFQVMIIILIKA